MPEYQEVLVKFHRQGKIPGFRPGKAPIGLVKQRYKEAIREDFLERVILKFSSQALKSENLSPLDTPHFKDLEFEEGLPLRFKAEFEVLPQLMLEDYKGVEVEKVEVQVSDQDVENSIQYLQERMAEYLPVDGRPVQAGDFAAISYSSRFLPDGTAGPEAKEARYEVGAVSSLPEFTEALTGMLPGDNKTFPVKYPADFPKKNLAEKEIEYSVELKEIKLKKLPELNDDFARDVGNFNSLEELRAKTKEDLLSSREKSARNEMEQRILAWILERNPFEVPEILVKERVEQRMEQYVKSLVAQGIHPQTLDIDWSDFQNRQRDRAVEDMRSYLLLEHVAGRENLEVSEEELEAEIERIAQESHQTLEAARSRLTKEGGADRIKSRLRHYKSLEFLYNQAVFRPAQGKLVEP
jgi:trigger factor